MTKEALDFLQTAEGQSLLNEYKNVDEKDLPALAMKLKKKGQPFVAELITTLSLRKKAQGKFTLADQMFFTPDGLQQSSDEQVSSYIAERFAPVLSSGSKVMDLTCGIGANAIALAKEFSVITVDLDEVHLVCAQANAKAYGVDSSIEFIHGDAFDHAQACDAFFVDPQRIRSGKTKTRSMFNSSPNIEELLPKMMSVTKNICVKISPAFDYKELDEWADEIEIELVSLDNSNKAALLWFGDFKTANRRATILDNDRFTVTDDESAAPDECQMPPRYLYLPNKAITKAHLVDEVAANYQLEKISDKSDLLASAKQIDYPKDVFRGFEVVMAKPFSKRSLDAVLAEYNVDRAHIIARNFMETPEAIRAKWKLKEGGEWTIILEQFEEQEPMLYLTKQIH